MYEGYAAPTIKFSGQAVNKAGDLMHFCYLSCDVSLKATTELILGSAPVVIAPLLQNQPKNFEFVFSFTIDANNVIHEMMKKQELEDVFFKLNLKGFWLHGPPGGQPPFSSSNTPSFHCEIGLPVDKYRRLLSTYYRNLSWVSVSRETYSLLTDLMNKKGFTSMDELMKSLISLSK